MIKTVLVVFDNFTGRIQERIIKKREFEFFDFYFGQKYILSTNTGQIVMIVHYMIRTQWFEDYPRWNDYFSPTSSKDLLS